MILSIYRKEQSYQSNTLTTTYQKARSINKRYGRYVGKGRELAKIYG
jgi:hypothetical protein